MRRGAQGLEVLKGAAAKTLFPYPTNLLHGDYIAVGDELRVGGYDSPKVSVRAALKHGGDKAPKPVLVQSPHDGSIHEVVALSAVRKLGKALQRSKEQAKKKAAKGGDDSKLSKKERQQLLARRQEKLKQRIADETVEAVAAAVAQAAEASWKKLPFTRMRDQAAQLHALARIGVGAALLDDAYRFDVVAVRRGWVSASDLSARVVSVETVFAEKLPLMATAEVLGVLAEVRALEWWHDKSSAAFASFYPAASLRELLESLGVDEKAIRAQVEKRVRQEEAAKEAAAVAPKEKADKTAGAGAKGTKGKGRRRAA